MVILSLNTYDIVRRGPGCAKSRKVPCPHGAYSLVPLFIGGEIKGFSEPLRWRARTQRRSQILGGRGQDRPGCHVLCSFLPRDLGPVISSLRAQVLACEVRITVLHRAAVMVQWAGVLSFHNCSDYFHPLCLGFLIGEGLSGSESLWVQSAPHLPPLCSVCVPISLSYPITSFSLGALSHCDYILCLRASGASCLSVSPGEGLCLFHSQSQCPA